MPGAPVLLTIVGPLRLTFWVLIVAAAVVLVLLAIVVARHLEWARAERRREHVRAELEPMFARFLETEDPVRLAEELRPVVLRLDAAHRPVAAVLVINLMHDAALARHTEQLRHTLEDAGIVELAEKGTRRLSPWRRALACELLGKIGAQRSVPVLLERLEDRRPEVRMSAVRALGDIRSVDAVPALSEAFLERRVAPTDVVNASLRRIGGEAGPAFERGVASPDPIVRVSSCFGLSGIASTHGSAVFRLAQVLGSDPDGRVRVAAAASLGIAGGGAAPAELLAATADPDVHVRRSAVKALGSFDDPTSGATLDERTEDEDREVAIRAAEALLALARRPRAAQEARQRLQSSSAWAVEYARKVAEVSA
jgi:HEAT repeat protein